MCFLQKKWKKSVKFGLGKRSNISLPRIGGSHPVPSLSRETGYSNVLANCVWLFPLSFKSLGCQMSMTGFIYGDEDEADNALLDQGLGGRWHPGWHLHSTLPIIYPSHLQPFSQGRFSQSNICNFRYFSRIVESDFRHQNFSAKSLRNAISWKPKCFLSMELESGLKVVQLKNCVPSPWEAGF